MSDIEAKVKAAVAEQLGKNIDEINDAASFMDDWVLTPLIWLSLS